MGRSKRGRQERQDFSALLQSMQEEKAAQEAGLSHPPEKPPKKAPASISPARQRMLSDQRNQFALVTRGSGFYIHDKSCPSLRSLPDYAITWLEKYDPTAFYCTQCEFKSYLRLGARDPARIKDYEALYEDFHFHINILRRMYVEDGMKTELIGSDTLKVWGREDTWLIKRIPATERGLELYHNNYKSKWDGSRVFLPGYHLQSSGNSRKIILDIIANYTYDGHKAAMARKRQQSAAAQVQTPVQTPPAGKPGLLVRLWAWLRTLFRK